MPKLLIYGLGAIISTLVFIFVLAFLIDINRVSVTLDPLQKLEQPRDKNRSVEATSWFNKLGKDKKDDFYYPVTEISIELDLDQNVDFNYRNRVRNFKLTTQPLNDYHYFCLKQVLEQSRVKHKLERYNNDVAVILYSQDAKVLDTIVKELNIYDIKSSVKEIRN